MSFSVANSLLAPGQGQRSCLSLFQHNVQGSKATLISICKLDLQVSSPREHYFHIVCICIFDLGLRAYIFLAFDYGSGFNGKACGAGDQPATAGSV